MPHEESLARFRLNDGQYFAEQRYTNLQWFLNGTKIGFGDLRALDLLRISVELYPHEEFVGWNEHHGTDHQQTDTPMVKVTMNKVTHRIELIREKEMAR